MNYLDFFRQNRVSKTIYEPQIRTFKNNIPERFHNIMNKPEYMRFVWLHSKHLHTFEGIEMDYQELYVNFKTRIEQLLYENELSMRKLSLSIGKNDDYIKKVLSGAITPPLPVLVDICNHFGITVIDLLSRENNYPVEMQRLNTLMKDLPKEKLEALIILLSDSAP